MRVYLSVLQVLVGYLLSCYGECNKDGSGSRYSFWLTIADDNQKIHAVYSKWLVEANKDVKYFIGTYWARLVDNIGTEISDFSSVSGRLQKLRDARDDMDNACNDWNTYKTVWPYSCFNKEFNCKFYEAVAASYTAANIGQDQLKTASLVGPDSTARAEALDKLFAEEILNYIPAKFVEEIFYSSGFMKETYNKLYLLNKQPKTFPDNSISKWYNWPTVESTVTQKCSSMAGKAVAEKYYCKAKDLMNFFESCLNLSEPEICLLDTRYMHHWDTGSVLDYWRVKTAVDKEIVTSTVSHFLQNLDRKVKENDIDGIKKLTLQYNPYLTVTDEYCYLSWPRRFTCDTDQCNTVWMYRPDCTLKLVSKAVQKYADLRTAGKPSSDQSVIDAKYAIQVWLTYPNVAEYIKSSETVSLLKIQKRMNDLLKAYDLNSLARLTETFPPSRYTSAYVMGKTCRPPSVEYSVFCILEPTINTVQEIAEKIRNQNNAAVLLNSQVNYRELLTQLQLEETNNKIIQQTNSYFISLSSSITKNFGYLANYFSALANFDTKKSEADISFIKGSLKRFDKMVVELSSIAARSMRVIMISAFTATAAELVQRIGEFALQVAAACNPITWLSGGNADDIMEALDEMVQAGVALAQVGSITANAIPDLGLRAANLQKNFEKNKDHLQLTKQVLDDLATGSIQTEDSVTKFLSLYNDYSPAVLRSDIKSYGEKFSSVTVGLCEAVFKGSSAASGLVEIGLASSGDCIKVGSQITELITVYEEMYDYQFDLMNSLAGASRSYLAAKKANDMKQIYSNPPSDLSLFVKENSVLTFALSSFHVWSVVTEYCDLLAYRNGGRMATVCTTAINNPSFRSFADVIAYQPSPVCNANNEITQYVAIPTTPLNKDDTAFINLRRLFGKETVNFNIPNPQWLLDQGWIHAGDTSKAIYVKRFEIYLPPMSGTSQHLIEVTANPGLTNKLNPASNKKYFLPLPGFTTRYRENVYNCYVEKIKNPYAICNPDDATQLCVTSNGVVDRDTQPSIYNNWAITVNAIPSNQNAPEPVTDFKLQGAVTLCLVNRSSKKRNARSVLRPRAYIRRDVQHCCSSSEYWNGSTCTTCPSGSVQKLAGYYCQKSQ